MTRPSIRGHHLTLIAALTGALMISFSAIFYGLSDVSPTTAAFFRAAYAIPILIMLAMIGRRRDLRPDSRRWLAVAAGLLLGADAVTWHSSIESIGSGLATGIANTSAIFVALGAWLLLGEKPKREVFAAIPIILVGVAMVSGLGQGDAFGEDPLRGTLLALLAAMFYASFILAFRHSNDAQAPGAGPLLEATVGLLVASLLIGLAGSNIDFAVTFPSHWWLIAMAVGSQVLGWLLIGYALPRIPAAETATIILIQPALTMAWAALIFGERPSTIQITGAMVVLGGVAFVTLARARSDVEPAVI
jgi:drug/metabolite transporter (DMT)-like permease